MTVTSHRYVEILQNFLEPRLSNLENVRFQQDRAAAYTARASTKVLREIFLCQLISQRGDTPLNHHTSPLAISTFENIFKQKLQITDQPKDAIPLAIATKPEAISLRALHNLRMRLQVKEGDAIFKTKWCVVVFSYNETKIQLRSLLLFLLMFQSREIILLL